MHHDFKNVSYEASKAFIIDRLVTTYVLKIAIGVDSNEVNIACQYIHMKFM